ncbi:MAG: succinate dehydrogenase/fumarate reductase iron-sulfur subunit [Magnetococcales bacterium]|nr:succinate dehydrogenase/fumarate reductase iron-sulfur subunit [Magnetococcales bacterium]MBF0155651.1 succinate dehydrogenase/fumarate reductase iron-sulfur subunit [Magnetococcales bacterium]
MSEETYTFRIQRNTPTGNGRFDTRWQEFKVTLPTTSTVLSALEEIKARQDGTLTFRQSCRSAICGSCAMRISGRTRLACKTQVGSVARDKVIEVGPQTNQPVLKDLAIDIRPFFERVRRVDPFLKDGPESAKKVTKTAYDQVNQVTQCIMCGCCYSDCTMAEVSPAFLGPAALAKSFRFVSDPREGMKTERLEFLSQPDNMWSCSRCTMCVEVCPKDVKPMEAIVKLRTRGLEKGLRSGVGARHALAFHEDIQQNGDLNEFTLMMRSVGLGGTLAELGSALHLMKKGKIPSPFPHKAEKLGELRKIYDILEKNPLDVETKAAEIVPE